MLLPEKVDVYAAFPEGFPCPCQRALVRIPGALHSLPTGLSCASRRVVDALRSGDYALPRGVFDPREAGSRARETLAHLKPEAADVGAKLQRCRAAHPVTRSALWKASDRVASYQEYLCQVSVPDM